MRPASRIVMTSCNDILLVKTEREKLVTNQSIITWTLLPVAYKKLNSQAEKAIPTASFFLPTLLRNDVSAKQMRKPSLKENAESMPRRKRSEKNRRTQ